MLVLAIGFAAPLIAEPLNKAEIFYARGDYAKAAELLLPLAEQGDPDAQNRLGFMYRGGLGAARQSLGLTDDWAHMMDSTTVRAHAQAAGGKGGLIQMLLVEAAAAF